MDAKRHGGGVRALLGGTETGRAGAGIGIATVEEHGTGFSGLEVPAGEEDGGGLHEIGGEDPCRRGGNPGDHQTEVATERAGALDTAGCGGGGESMGGIHATGDAFEGR